MGYESTMAILQIENLPDDLYSRIENLAAQENVSLNDAVIQLLKQALQPVRTDIAQNQQLKPMAEVLTRIRRRPRVNPVDFGLPDSTILIREDRSR